MTLMAGFDLVAEVSNSALLNLIKTQFTIQGIPANPPFEFDIPITAVSANAHMIVSEILLDLTDDDRMTLTLKFQNSSVISQSQPITVSLLEGDLTITAPLLLTARAPSFQVLTIDFAAADVTMIYTTLDNKILQGLEGSGITVQTFKGASNQAIVGFVRGMGLIQLTGVTFPVIPGADGSLSPLIFEKLEVHCIGNPNPALQTLAFFGILLVANDANGDHTLKTSTAIIPGSSSLGPREVAISLSPEIFHRMLFCPGMASALGTIVPLLPVPCGGGLIVQNGVAISLLWDSFAAGHVNVDGLFSESGFCHEADGAFHGEITFSATGTTVTPFVQFDEPEIDVDIDWYCGPAGGVAVGLTALINVAIVDAIAEAIANGLAGDTLQGALGSSLPTSNVGGFANAQFDLVTPTIEGLTIHGTIPVFVPFKSGVPQIQLSGSVTTTSTEIVSTGTYHYAGIPLICDAKDFPYSQVAQKQTATYQVIPEFMGLPLQLEWRIGDLTLANVTGTLTVPEHCHSPFPLDSGGTSWDQDVHIGYVVGADSIQLKNIPAEGNYYFTVSVTATDPSGLVAESGAYVTFEGDTVVFGGGYEDYVNECQKALREWVYQITDDFTASTKPIPRWVPIDKPPPEKVFQLIYSLAASSKPLVKAALAQTITAHHSSFLGALFGAKTGSIPGVKGKIKGPSV